MRKRAYAIKTILFFASLFVLVAVLSGCVSGRGREQKIEPISRDLRDKGTKSADQLFAFFAANNKDKKKQAVAKRLAKYYVEEGKAEGINSDCAFVQMCLETGFLRFGGLVTPDMHNYCGLGSMDAQHPGEVFATEREGVRAHIQHLHAYATPENVRLVNELIDPRYKWVLPRGKAPTVRELAGTWAADPEYGRKLEGLLARLEKF